MWIGLLYYFNFVQVPALKAGGRRQHGGGHHAARRSSRSPVFPLVRRSYMARRSGAARVELRPRLHAAEGLRGHSASERGSARSCCSTCGR
jgi:hypothetical protein